MERGRRREEERRGGQRETWGDMGRQRVEMGGVEMGERRKRGGRIG